ncbi:hypothetical protein CRE_26708 [Caenorhabditis remanei]|uniref:Uncharacterized protein n=1 Tax=Caenorhabditis remanei TaxID=31234 RepID=E3MXS8_CAERE|nr:hypothetical protein CRE_26708 [Caenorhabditis remanei]
MSSFENDVKELLYKEASPAVMAELLNAFRDKMTEEYGFKFNKLKPTESLKVPEIQCGRNYIEDLEKLIEEAKNKYPSDDQKQLEEAENTGDDNFFSCLSPSRNEINCKAKECEGSKDLTMLCVCGPKKGSEDGDKKKDDDEEDGSSSLFVFGTILHLTIFYLIASFF